MIFRLLRRLLDSSIGAPAGEGWINELTDHGVHVWPLDDRLRHELAGDRCICGPAVIFTDDDGTAFELPIIVHHSLDGRELLESGGMR